MGGQNNCGKGFSLWHVEGRNLIDEDDCFDFGVLANS